MLHVWYIYLQNWVIFRAHAAKYSTHWASGDDIVDPCEEMLPIGMFNSQGRMDQMEHLIFASN